MKTLRTAFLSGLALELIATISVAVVAVFIGVRLVYGHMGLEAGLLALILAPEAYLPLRELGAAYHSSEDGVEALERSEKFIGGGTARAPAAAPRPRPGRGNVLEIRNLTVRHAGRGEPVLRNAGPRPVAGAGPRAGRGQRHRQEHAAACGARTARGRGRGGRHRRAARTHRLDFPAPAVHRGNRARRDHAARRQFAGRRGP